MKEVLKKLWVLAFGLALTAGGGYLMVGHLEDTVLTVSVLAGIVAFFQGVSLIADAWR